jgi:hypothetical protein
MPRVATKLEPTGDGGWKARKRIPQDAQDAYEGLYGVRWEARFRCGPMSVGLARAEHRKWLNELEARINNIRAERKGEGITLTDKQARALSGEWYHWFTTNHLERQSPVAHWKLFVELLSERAVEGARYEGDPDDPAWSATNEWRDNFDARAPARAMAADWAESSQFLHAKHLTLAPPSRDLFLDFICRDLFVALDLLIRRGEGDWSEDTHTRQFPKFEAKGDQGLTPEALFARWVVAKKPRPSTATRWRGVFIKLMADFPTTNAATLTAEQAQGWCNSLITLERTAATVNDTWRNAANTVFRWALKQKLLGLPLV